MGLIDEIARTGRLWTESEASTSFAQSSLLDELKQDVIGALEQQGAPELSLALATIRASSLVEDLTVPALPTIPTRPVPKTSRPGLQAAIDKIEQLARPTKNTTETEAQLAELIGQVNASRQQIEALSSATTVTSRFVVDEINERFYRTGVVQSSRTREAQEPQVISTSGIDSLDGYDFVGIQPDGTISLISPSGEPLSLSLRAQNPTVSQSTPIEIDIDAVIEDVEFERWACDTLAVGDLLVDALSELTSVLTDMIDIREGLALIAARLPIGPVRIPVASQAKALISSLESSVASIVDVEALNTINVLGAAVTLQIPQVSQGRPVTSCDINRQAYCAVKSASEAIRLKLGGALFEYVIPIDEVGLSVVTDVLTDIDIQIDAANALLEPIRQIIAKLPTDACALIQGVVQGTPQSFQDAITKAGELIVFLDAIASALSAAGLATDPVVINALSALDSAGYDQAADALLRGDLAGFLGSSLQTATHAGKMANLLREAASQAGDNSSRLELLGLADVAQSRANAVIHPQRVRDLMGERTAARRQRRAQGVTDRALVLARRSPT